MTLDLPRTTDEILTTDLHLVQSFADLNALKQSGARTAIVAAEGAMVRDSDGNELIDGIGGLWCVNVGHGRREIIEAITEQLQTLDFYSTFYSFTHPAAAALSAKLAELAPGSLNKVYFGNSGSVANDSAVRILHHYYNRLGQPKKRLVLSRQGAYHGSTYLSIAMTTPEYSDGWSRAEGLVHYLRKPHYWHEGDGMTEAEFLDALMEDMRSRIETLGAENIACFVAEPIMGAGGVIVPPKGYHKRALEICRDYEIKYISDEVVTAFGRLGHFFASEAVFDIQPDIINTAKGLTSGYQPLSATIMSDEIHEVISGPGGSFLHGMTYSGHPAAAAAGLANIALMERDEIPQKAQVTGKLFEETLKGLEDIEIVGEVRGSHFMIGIELVKDKATKTLFDPDLNIGMMVAQKAQSKGLIARPLGHILILSPTLIMTPELIARTGAILRESILEVMASLKAA
ncbi:aminotransferase class III-fold pyridoxal phosphate-dependent enzyme [Pseudodonghicola flavimaris]|uniref:Aminotransferase class III-fold pyridoxal phosphate-dependent enzyme n=1 Tax=Pseudodonghicola flavimaris TaxID=3050036 RepID=A0ABT7F3Z3_9RHOB|nr:aminotransferase class III-fold pyridoxal phosphate-dependent enzyme [Pseudodonghicola flavimaris]MDK3019323.1 aminotransferase class III-fold pyridoxal phosphate-dependent enzyme [Pseudodonghicola flavimaris]